MSAMRMVPRDLFACQITVTEEYVHNQVGNMGTSTESKRHKPQEKFIEKQSPSQASIVSTADYDGSTQCDTASNPDLEDVIEHQNHVNGMKHQIEKSPDQNDQIETKLLCLAQSYGKYAHCVEDIYIMMKFAQLVKIPRIAAGYAKLVLRTLKMLHLCKYPTNDILIIMAHASAYFAEVCKVLGDVMDEAEANNILVPIVFIAHSYVMDEHCPLKVWHKHLLRKYCSLKILNAAVVQILQQRDYILRLDETDLAERIAYITPMQRSLN